MYDLACLIGVLFRCEIECNEAYFDLVICVWV